MTTRAPYLFFALALTWGTPSIAQVDMGKLLQGMQLENDDSPFVPNAYVGSFRMEMHTYSAGEELKNSPIDMHYWSNKSMLLVQTTGESIKQEVKMLTDLEGKWQYMLMTDAQGKQMAMKSRKKKVTIDAEAQKNVADVNITEEMKEIEGHVCYKTISKSEKGVWTGWLAKDIEAPFTDMMRQVQQPGNNAHNEVLAGAYGMPLEYEWVDANGKDRIVCHIRDLKVGEVNEKVFSLEGYEVMEMSSFGK